MKYFTDEEIFEALEVYATACEGSNYDMIYMSIERIRQKQKQIECLHERLNTAANIIGHNMISEAMYD